MIVIAKKGTKKIIKGHRYEVQNLYNTYTDRGRVYLKGIGVYTVHNFTDIDGKDLPKISWNSSTVQEKRTTFEELKVNDIIICNSDRYTTLIKDAKYRIDDIKTTTRQIVSKIGRSRTVTHNKIKFEGCNRYFEFNSCSFRKLPTGEARALHLSSLLENEEHSFSVDTSNRKIDIIDNKNAALVKALAKSIIDGYRHELGIVDWACQKSASRLKITKDDYKHLLKMPLKDILKIVETK